MDTDHCRRALLGLWTALAWAFAASGRTVMPLGGAGWTCDGEAVTVPHTWNVEDACDGPNGTTMKWNGDSAMSTNSYVRKRAVYRRTLQVSPKPDRRYFLKFEGASVKADVTLNGRPVGRHVGAFTAFAFEVTDFLRNGENALEVGVDNRYDESTQPMSADFSVYGGLYRPVWLIETGRACIDPVTDGADGVKVAADPKTGEVAVDVSVLGGTNETQRFRVEDFELWSPEHPKLYTRTIGIDQGGTTDAVGIRFAFRTFEFREDGFYLNGKKRQLRGVNRHQDRAGKGWAVSPADEEEDIRLIKEMGADALRTAHYPNSRHIYDLCDELGLIVWLEYPNVNMLTFTDEFERGMHRQVCEMVAQYRNHPSVAMWSIWNELYVVDWGDGEGWVLDPEKALGVTTRMRDLIHRLDPSRPVVAATDKPRMREMNDVPDQLAYNRYPGWYSPLDMHEMLDEMFAADDRKILGMSEYGIGGSVRQHGDPKTAVKPSGPWHPEEYQAWRMHDNLLELTRDARIWGHYVWAMFDFAADRRTEGDRHGINDKGLLTHDHKTKKDAYYLYRAAWSQTPTLHLVGSRMTSVTGDTVNVLGFSNVGDVTLLVNGREVGRRAPDEVGGVFWSRVKLDPGENEVELRAGSRSSRCIWKRAVEVENSDEAETKAVARVHYEGDDVRVRFAADSAVRAWALADWRGKTIRSGVLSANGEAAVGRLPPGYWAVSSGDDRRTFTVVVDPRTRRRVTSSPFGADSALSWVGSPNHFTCNLRNSYRHVAWIMRAAGLVETRERLKWGGVQPQPGGIAWGHYLDNARMLKSFGIEISGLFHDAPAWTRTGDVRKAGPEAPPRDLLALYRFAEAAGRDFGDTIYDWEVWNEPESVMPAWEVTALTKVFALGCRAASPGMHVTNPSTVRGLDCIYDGLLFSNHMFKYADIFNIHSYHKLEGYAPLHRRALDLLARRGCADVPLMITERGTDTEGRAELDCGMEGVKCHSPEQEMAVADFIPKSQILGQVDGVMRSHFFVFGAFNERGGRKDWGVLRRDGSAKPGVAAFSALTSCLQGLECLGTADCGPDVRAFAYADADGSKTLAFWGRGTVEVEAAEGTLTLTDWCGTPRKVEPVDGRARIPVGEHVSYLHGKFSVRIAKPAVRPPEPKPYVAAADEDLGVVIVAYFDPDDFRLTDGNNTAEVVSNGCGRVEIAVWNFSDRIKKGRVASKNGRIEGFPDEIKLPAFGVFRRTVVLHPELSDGDIADWKLRGVFDGRKTSMFHARIRDISSFLGRCRAVEPDWRNAANWRINDSASHHGMSQEPDGSMRFDAEWEDPSVGRWSYPALSLPKGFAKGAKMIEYEVRTWQDKVENDFGMSNVFLNYGNGREAERIFALPPIGKWEIRRVGIPGVNDPAEIKSVELGGGHPKGMKLKVWIRNVRFLCSE